MLEHFVPIAYTVVDHIHLGAVPLDGSAPTGLGDHGEPPYYYGHIDKRTPHYETMDEFIRAWDGTPSFQVLRANDSTPIVFSDIQYSLRTNQEGIDILMALLKRKVLLVDNRHCTDTEDHTPFIKIMYFADLSYEGELSPMLQYVNVSITFKDMQTITSV